MKNDVLAPCIATLLLMLVISLCYFWKITELQSTYDKEHENRLIESAITENTWKISYQKATRRGRYSQIDATDRFVYIAYSRSSCVDVYNAQGEFQYALLFPNCQNGGVQIRCVENYLYVSAKNNTIYIFDGTEEIACMEYSQAIHNGYDYFWFEEKKSFQENDGAFYIETDQSGAVVKKIQLPNLKPNINAFRMIALIISFFVYLYFMLRFVVQKYIVF